MQDIFDPATLHQYTDRLRHLTAEKTPCWGKMDAAQMLAHLNVAYDMVYHPEKYQKPGPLTRLVLQKRLKKMVTGEQPYPRNIPAISDFIIREAPDFRKERDRLINHLQRTQKLGRDAFEGKENLSFGRMTAQEWNNLFAKHINHHFEQFGI